MYCEQAETILPLLALGELEGERRADLEAHLADCPACRAKLADLRATLELLDEAVNRLPQARLSDERRKTLVRVAAVRPAAAPRASPVGYRILRWARTAPVVKLSPLVKIAAVLLICIVLAALLLPALSVSREKSRRMSTMNNLGQTVKAMTTYEEPNSDFFPDRAKPKEEYKLAFAAPSAPPRIEAQKRLDDRRAVSSRFLTGSEVPDRIGTGAPQSAPATGPVAKLGPGQNVESFDSHVKWTESNFVSNEKGDRIDTTRGGGGGGGSFDYFVADGSPSEKPKGGDQGGVAVVNRRLGLGFAAETGAEKSNLTADDKDMVDYLSRLRQRDWNEEAGHKAEMGAPISVGGGVYAKGGPSRPMVVEKAAEQKPTERAAIESIVSLKYAGRAGSEDERVAQKSESERSPGNVGGQILTLSDRADSAEVKRRLNTVRSEMDRATELGQKALNDNRYDEAAKQLRLASEALDYLKPYSTSESAAGTDAQMRALLARADEGKAEAERKVGQQNAWDATTMVDEGDRVNRARREEQKIALFNEANAQYAQGKYQAALAIAEQIKAMDPDFAPVSGLADEAREAMRNRPLVASNEATAKPDELIKWREKLTFPDAIYQYPTKETLDQINARGGVKLPLGKSTEAPEGGVIRLGTAADAPATYGFSFWKAPDAGPQSELGPVAALPPATPGAPPSDGPAVQTAPIASQADESAKRAEAEKALNQFSVIRADEPATTRPAFKAGPVNPWVMASQDALSTFGIDVDTASYAIARNYIARGMLPPAASVRMEEYVNAFDYNYPTQASGLFSVHAEAGPSPFGGPGLTLLKVGVRARVFGREARKPAHLVFVVDASGSMEKPDRMPLVKYALRELVEKLAPNDRVSLVTFNTHALIVLEAVPASDKKCILEGVEGLRCCGSTNLIEGLQLGYQLAARVFTAGATNRVVLCSDGVANIGDTDADAMLAQVEAFRRQGVTLTTTGVGFGGYDDVLLERLANKGDGNYVFVDTEAEARRVFVEEMAATLRTVAADAKIQVAFDPARVRRYRLIGFENRDIADVDFRNDTVDAGEVGSGQSSTALYELELLPPAEGAIGDAGLGTVFVRYRDTETGRVEEIANRLSGEIVRPRTVKDSPRFFLAACAAQFAEILRGSEHARNGSLAQVRPIIQSVAAELPLDARVQELADMIQKADGLPRAE